MLPEGLPEGNINSQGRKNRHITYMANNCFIISNFYNCNCTNSNDVTKG